MTDVRCTWTAVSGVDGYNVYLKSNGEFVKHNSVLITDTTYDIAGLADGSYQAYAKSVLNDVESDASNTKSFEVGVAFESTDFTEYADTTALRTEWIEKWQASPVHTLESATSNFGNKLFQMQTGDTNFRQVVWDGKGAVSNDQELLALCSQNINTFGTYLWLRGGGTSASNKNGYYAQRAETNLRLRKYVNNNFAEIASATPSFGSWEAGNQHKYWFRFNVNGTALKVKTWKYGEAEPTSWDIEETDTSLNSGEIGISMFQTTLIGQCDWFGIAYDGATVPVPS